MIFGAVAESSKSRATKLTKGSKFRRAQEACKRDSSIHHHELFAHEDSRPAPPKRMKPLPYSAHEGRVNPKGIPCLYMATDNNTAMTEVCPQAASILTVAKMVLTCDVIVVDCTCDSSFELKDETPERLERNAWYCINEAFPLPSLKEDALADYAPTQYPAGVFRESGFGGIMYRSAVGSGNNVALFDLKAARVSGRQLHDGKKISIEFKRLRWIPVRRRNPR